MNRKATKPADASDLRHRAEARVQTGRGRSLASPADTDSVRSVVDSQRLVHELQVHRVELEMQNAELKAARDHLETLLEKYTDLYDFAPVGYFSLDEQGRILEVNLTGATLLGVERSRLLGQRLEHFAAVTSRAVIRAFLERVLSRGIKQVCEATLVNKHGIPLWVSLHGTCAISASPPARSCRLAVLDISARKQAEEAQRHLDLMIASNHELRKEIARREAVEKALRDSRRSQNLLLKQSRHMQDQLRRLSHQILQAHEEERKRISRELHDEITQTLVGINVHLEALAHEAEINPARLRQRIARTQQQVEKSVNIVHRFARELRPTSLDDVGLIRTLHSVLKDFMKRTGIQVQFSTFAGVEKLNGAKRTVLYRVIQSALANVAQHARASHVEVSIRKLPGALHMAIADNGKSFDVERVTTARANRRLGLLGMRERVEMVGGQLSIESVSGRGTTIRVQIPFRSVRPRRRALRDPSDFRL